MTAYHDGRFLEIEDCCISPLDRGFLFGDGVYEVMPVWGRRPFRYQAHINRLARSLERAEIKDPYPPERWREVVDGLIERSGLSSLVVYLQVTRGVAPREHVIADAAAPTVFAMTMPPPPNDAAAGVAAITADDTRWSRCDIKSVSLLPNVLLRRRARDYRAWEAILLRDGCVTEGAASNVFIAAGGVLATPPEGPQLLSGITRGVVIEMAAVCGVGCEQRTVTAAELAAADEVWLTSSTRGIVPVTTLDGNRVGAGEPGPLWKRFSDCLADWCE